MNARWQTVMVLVVRAGFATMTALSLCVSLLLALDVMSVHAAEQNDQGPLYLPLVSVIGDTPAPTVFINEFMADNDGVVADEHGEYDDVIELYNPGLSEVDLGGMYLTDDLSDTQAFRIPDGVTVAAGGYLLFWADGDPAQGELHADFSLSKGGESIGLFDTVANGNALVDGYTFGPQATDVSEGRCPDGGSSWTSFATPTMGASNEPCGTAPVISELTALPVFPQQNEPVTVTVTITDDGVILTATLLYSAGLEFAPVAMDDVGGGTYQGAIPGQSDGTWVQYYVSAEDDARLATTNPVDAPEHVYSYVAGFQHPEVWLNEVMADNVASLEDPDDPGEFPDWLELYNAGAEAVDLGGYYLTDDLRDSTQYSIPHGVVIPAGGYLVFYADDESDQGPLHTNFKLSAGGESIGLFADDGKVQIDAVTYQPQEADESAARRPDGTGEWGAAAWPTPGQSNDTEAGGWLPLTIAMSDPPPLPLRLDCAASEPYVAADGSIYLADRALTAGASFGYLGGYEDLPVEWWDGYPVGHTNDEKLYKTQRLNWQEYRVQQIPNGDYLLTLRFAEQVEHGPGFSIFDIVAEGQTLADNLDVYAQVGRYNALDLRFSVAVTDGELNVVAVPVTGESHLAALELEPRDRDSVAPSVPTGLTAFSNYGGVLLDWADNREDDLAGYNVYRAIQEDGPYSLMTESEPVHWSRAEDSLSVAHTPVYYRISAVDVYGNESGLGGPAAASAIQVADAQLPLYELGVEPQNLAILDSDPMADLRVRGTFTWQGVTRDVEVRYRGSSSRTFDKKSWKVVFSEDDSPFAQHDRINVNANFLDRSLIRAKLANDLFAAADLRPPHSELVLLTLNGEYRGVYTRNEQVDEGFLLNSGRNPGASIYKVNGRFLELLPTEASYRRYYEKETNEELGHEDVIQFVESINLTPDEDFVEVISGILDVESYLSYYAMIVLTSHFDSSWHNVYLVHDLDTGLWELVPWDMDMTFSKTQAPINMGSMEDPQEGNGHNILRSRMLAVPEFREIYCQRLDRYMDTIFSDREMYKKVDELYDQVASDGYRDWRKLGWESNADLAASPVVLKRFVTERSAFLREEMNSFCFGK